MAHRSPNYPPRGRPAALLVGLAVGALTCAGAAAVDFEPADPEGGRLKLSKMIEKPSGAHWDDGTAIVNCQVLVSRRGRADGLKCGLYRDFEQGSADQLVAATYNGLRRARFRPARVAGDSVDVVMSVRVVVRCIARRCKKSTYPNLGLFEDKYGSHYVAPQEIISDRATWYEHLLTDDVCRTGNSLKEACVDEGIFRLNLYVDVDDQGRPTLVRHTKNPLTADADAIMQAAEGYVGDVRFLPGLVDDEPTSMTVLSSSLHYTDNPQIPETICIEQHEIGWRLPRTVCYNPQEYARVTASLQIISWLPITNNN
ncbi:MAG: hypothetical protein AAFX85_14045 [Pseudomonadota bacterium]